MEPETYFEISVDCDFYFVISRVDYTMGYINLYYDIFNDKLEEKCQTERKDFAPLGVDPILEGK